MSPIKASRDSVSDPASDPVKEALIFDLLEWLANGNRTYEDVMDAWRTSCPKLTIWEDASDRGLVAFERVNECRFVRPSPAGLALIDQRTRQRVSEAPRKAG
jgi:hypothetical protein